VDRLSLGVAQPRPWRLLDAVLDIHPTTT